MVNPLVDALLGPRARGNDPDGAAIIADAFRRADCRGMYAAVRWLSLRRPDLTPVIARLDMPTLLTTGVDDPMWTVANARAAAAHLSRGALVILPGAGHIGPLLQAAPAVVDLVTKFWRDPDSALANQRDVSFIFHAIGPLRPDPGCGAQTSARTCASVQRVAAVLSPKLSPMPSLSRGVFAYAARVAAKALPARPAGLRQRPAR